jgi:hypothetical protein
MKLRYIAIISLVCIILFLLFATPIFFKNSNAEPITTYFRPMTEPQAYANPPDSISISIIDPFANSEAQIEMNCVNFTPQKDISNFSSIQLDDYLKSNSGNATKFIQSYIFTTACEFPNRPSYKNTVPLLEEVTCIEPIRVKTNPFFKQTSINTWEGAIFFDSWNASLNVNHEIITQGPLLKIVPNKLIITLKIPDNYDIVPSDKLKIEKIPEYYLVTSELKSGEMLDIKVSQKGLYGDISILVSFVCPLIVGWILGPIIENMVKHHKSKKN